MKPKSQFTLAELTKGLDVTIQGDSQYVITGISTIQQAKSSDLTFLTNPLYRKYLEGTQAGAVILGEADVGLCSRNLIICHNPYYIYAKMAEYFSEKSQVTSYIHSSTVIGNDCEIHPSAWIDANCVIGEGVKIGAHVIIGAGSIIGDQTEIAEGVQLDARVTIYSNITIGKRTRIASGAVIGSDGFGFASHKDGWHKVPQLGSVIIGEDVDIGANTSIDRGAIENTIIENGVKLDNLIQVGHNVRIGAHTIIAGCVAIAGSTMIGKNCMIGGASCFAGHLSVCDNVVITGMTAVTKSILEPGIYSSGIVGAVPNFEFRKNNARFHRLENLIQRVKTLETSLKEMTERNEI